MSSHEAAVQVLEDLGKPMASKDLAIEVLRRKLVSSSAQDPVYSVAQTIDKYIRTYPNGPMAFMKIGRERLVTLTNKKTNGNRMLSVNIPTDVYNKIALVQQSGLASSFDEAATLLLKTGLKQLLPEIRESLNRILED